MSRDSYFDNYKAFLIILVVVAHFIGPFRGESHFMDFAVKSIYSFHMPAFVFVTAYFSRHNNFIKLVKGILIPYVLFQFIYFILLNYLWGKPSDFQVLLPKFALWYLLSVFCWRLLIDKIINIKGILPISFLIGILIGFDTTIGALGALGRTITFLPFFILGHQFDKEKFINYANKKIIKIATALILFIIFTIIFFKSEHIDFNVLTMKYAYKKADMLEMGWIYRTLVYVLSTSLIYLIGVIIPRNKHWYTYLGQRTMSIYLLHGIIYKSIQYQTHIYDKIDTKLEMAFMTLFAIALSFILSWKPFAVLIQKLTKIPVEKFLKSKEDSIRA